MGWHWGVLASSGGGAAGAYELISTTVLSTTTATVTFSSIPSIYKHLQIRYLGRSNVGSTTDYVQIRMNSDSGSNYASHYLLGSGSSVSSGAVTAQNLIYVGGFITGSTSAANSFGAGIIDLWDYTGTKNKTIRSLSGHTDSRISLSSGVWLSTAALSSITLLGASGSFVAGSRFSLYGVLG